MTNDERVQVLAVLHQDRFMDRAPAEIYATLLDEGVYLCSISTMYRVLAANHEVRERRDQLTHPIYAKPELLATGPNEVWSWDITKLKGPTKWSYFQLYVIIDIFSRCVVGWMLADRESSFLASKLIRETCQRHGIEPGSLKHIHNLADEVVCERWIKNPYFQHFCGETFFQQTLPVDRSSMTRWRQRIGADELAALVQESLAAAHRGGALRPQDLERITVDTTVQPKAVTFPTDAKLMHKARERLVRLAKEWGIELRQSYARVGRLALMKQARYAHAKQHTGRAAN